MKDFIYGLRRGMAIGVSYLAVSFAFGVYAATGLSPLMAILMSATNLTSSGQFAGVQLIIKNASLIEIGLTVLLINLRYILMSFSLSQNLDSSFNSAKRIIAGFAITDEVYAVAVREDKPLTFSFMMGLLVYPWVGWVAGTALGVVGATFIGERLLTALNIALYAMFMALIMNDVKKKKDILAICLIAIGLSFAFKYVPYINTLNSGLKIIIPTIIASVLGALLFPLKEDKA